jgi:hypothetical protein
MKLSEYIQALQKIYQEHVGDDPAKDLDVETIVPSFDRVSAAMPRVRYRKILSKRQSKPAFWSKYDSEESRGEKVVEV